MTKFNCQLSMSTKLILLYQQVIKQTQPNVVFLELCDSRLSILSLDEKTIIDESKSMGIAKIRRNIRDVSYENEIYLIFFECFYF